MSGDGAITAQEVLSLQADFTTTDVCARSHGMMSHIIQISCAARNAVVEASLCCRMQT